MKVRSVQIGAPVVQAFEGRSVTTAFFKHSVTCALQLGKLGFAGDQQVDREHHGGPDKAVLAYPGEHYADWERLLGRPPGAAAFGENLTLEGLTEETACIGDVYRIGNAVLQVCQPRIPCFKVSVRHGVSGLPEEMMKTGRTGFYLRVVKEGLVAPGDPVTLTHRPEGAPSVAMAHRTLHDSQSREELEHLAVAEGLAPNWQEYARKRLAKL